MGKKRDFSKERMDSGIKRQQALGICIEFLGWYKDYLEDNSPTAHNTIKEIEEVLMCLSSDINELCETE